MNEVIKRYYERKLRLLRQQAFDYDLTEDFNYTSSMSKVNTQMIIETKEKLSKISAASRTTECTGGYSFLNIG